MKRRSIYLLLLALMLLFWSPATFTFNGWMARGQAEQDFGLRLVGTAVTKDPSKNLAIIEY